MKTTYDIYANQYSPSAGGVTSKVIKSFRHKQEAVAFLNDRKNIYQYGEMTLVEKAKQPSQEEPI